MIRLQQVKVSFGALPVLDNISCQVRSGEVVAVLGTSGSGKTTLLRVIAGLVKPESGTVQVDSQRIGFIFQDNRLVPWLNAEDNIALALKASGTDSMKAAETAKVWLQRLGLEGFNKYYPAQLSGGMAQRVSIARAFAIEPQIMLLDEPFSGLDADLADSLLKDLKVVLEGYRAAVVLVTHNPVEAISLAGRILRLTKSGCEETPVSNRRAMLEEYYKGQLRDIVPDKGF